MNIENDQLWSLSIENYDIRHFIVFLGGIYEQLLTIVMHKRFIQIYFAIHFSLSPVQSYNFYEQDIIGWEFRVNLC